MDFNSVTVDPSRKAHKHCAFEGFIDANGDMFCFSIIHVFGG